MRKPAIKSVFFAVALLMSACFAYGQEPLPSYRGPINDLARVLSTEQEAKVIALIEEVERKTSTEIAVVSLETIAPYTESQYAQMLFDEWKIGKKGRDNGVIILLAVKDRRWRIHTGYGLESVLTDALCTDIGNSQMVPYFKEGKYGEGLYYGTAAVAKAIAKDARVSLDSLQGVRLKKFSGTGAPWPLYFFLPAFFAVWNIPWPIFIGLPFTLLFAGTMFASSALLSVLIMAGYAAAMLIRIKIWSKIPVDQRRSMLYVLLMGFLGHKKGTGKDSGRWVSGFGGGGSSGGSRSSGGGGRSGGGGAGGGF